MSGFFGVFKRNNGTLNLDDFREMELAVSKNAVEPPHIYVDERLAVAFGHVLVRVSPESALDHQPLQSNCGNYMLTGHFRLDYRSELAAKLCVPINELALYCDSRLVMLAWLKWGRRCIEHLSGDWAFAIYDKRERELFLAKDQFSGYSALHYTCNEDTCYFASDVNVLAAVSSIKKELDLVQLARISFRLTHVKHGATLLKNVFALKEAHYLVVNATSEIREIRYWSLFENETIRYKNDGDYIEHFRFLFQESVRTRLRTNKEIGVSLSAGFDSSAVAATAANELQVHQRLLHSYTSVPLFLDKMPENEQFRYTERPAVEEFAKSFSNLVPHFEDLSGYSFIEPITDGTAFDFVAPTLNPNIAWTERILSRAGASGIGRMLNGQMGNATTSWHLPRYHSGLLMKGRILKLIRELNAIGRVENRSFLNSFKVHVAVDLKQSAACLLNQLRPIYKNVMLRESILSEEVLNALDWDEMKDEIVFLPQYTFLPFPQMLRKAMMQRANSYAGQRMYSRAHRYGMEAADPTADARLAAFSLQIPENLWLKDGVRKFLYKEVFRGIVPEQTMNNRFAFLQSADAGFRFENDAKFRMLANDYVDKASTNALLNVSKMHEHIRKFNKAANWKEKKILGSLLLADISLADFLDKCKFVYGQN